MVLEYPEENEDWTPEQMLEAVHDRVRRGIINPEGMIIIYPCLEEGQQSIGWIKSNLTDDAACALVQDFEYARVRAKWGI